jgi:hypothetical protein
MGARSGGVSKDSILARLQADPLADRRCLRARGIDLDHGLGISCPERDLDPAPRAEAVYAPHGSLERRVRRRNNRHFIRAHEQARGSALLSLPVERDRLAPIAQRAALDLDRHDNGFADEFVHEWRDRPFIDILGRPGLLDAAAVHDHDAIRHLQGFLLIMGDEDGCHMDLGVKIAQPAPQLLAHLGIERAERFVEQQHARLDRERPGEGDPLTLSAGELAWIALRDPAELNKIEQPLDARANLRLGQAIFAGTRAQAESDVFKHGHVAEQRIVLEHETDMALADAAGEGILAVELNFALVRPIEAGDDAQQRGLAGARGSEQG